MEKILPQLLSSSNHLLTPLGRWIKKLHILWSSFYEPTTDTLFHKSHSSWHSYTRRPGRTRHHRKYQQGRLVSAPPTSARPATVEDNGGYIISLDGFAPTEMLPLFPTLLQRPNNYWILQHCTGLQSNNNSWMIRGLESGTLLAVCDGYYKPNLCSSLIAAAWKLENGCNNTIVGTAAVMGHVADSYRV